MTQRGTPQVIGVRHVGLSRTGPGRARRVLSGRARPSGGRRQYGGDLRVRGRLPSSAAARPRSHTIWPSSPIPPSSTPAFKVASLADLRALYQWVIGRGDAGQDGVSTMARRSPSTSTTRRGTLVEVYWPTGVASRQPHGGPLDLTRSDEALRRDVAELAVRTGAPTAADSARKRAGGGERRRPEIPTPWRTDGRQDRLDPPCAPERCARGRVPSTDASVRPGTHRTARHETAPGRGRAGSGADRAESAGREMVGNSVGSPEM